MNLGVNEISKYLLGGIIIFFTLKYTTQNRFQNAELGMITGIAILVLLILQYTAALLGSKPEADTAATCNSYCSMKEHLTNVPAVNPDYAAVRDALDKQTPPPQQVVTNTPDKNSPDYAKYRDLVDKLEQIRQHKTSNDNYIVPSDKISRNADGSYTVNLWRDPQAKFVGSRSTDGVIQNEVKYNYESYNILPPNLNDGEYPSYSEIPPLLWYATAPPAFPPVCVSEKRATVCPALTNREYADLKEWDGDARRITGPDSINSDYVMEKLNSGR